MRVTLHGVPDIRSSEREYSSWILCLLLLKSPCSNYIVLGLPLLCGNPLKVTCLASLKLCSFAILLPLCIMTPPGGEGNSVVRNLQEALQGHFINPGFNKGVWAEVDASRARSQIALEPVLPTDTQAWRVQLSCISHCPNAEQALVKLLPVTMEC